MFFSDEITNSVCKNSSIQAIGICEAFDCVYRDVLITKLEKNTQN